MGSEADAGSQGPADVRSVVGEVPEMTAGQVAAAYVRATIVVRENGKTLAEPGLDPSSTVGPLRYAAHGRNVEPTLINAVRYQ